VKSLVFRGKDSMLLEEREAPRAAEHEVICRVLAAGICGSELEAYQGISEKRRAPLVFGHELVVEVVGDEPRGHFIVNPLRVCGACPNCLSDRSYLCEFRRLISLHLDGGQSEFIAIPVSDLIPWDDPNVIKGVLAEPAATAFHALGGQSSLAGSTVAVIGCGAIGLLTVLVARGLGADSVVAFDPLDARLEIAIELGAVRLDPAGHRRAANIVVDTVGSQSSRESALELVRSGGVLRLVGLRNGPSMLEFSEVVGRGIAVEGIYAYNRSHIERAIKILEATAFDLSRLVSTYDLVDGATAYADLVERPADFVKVALIPEGTA
jgi:2-desacetyl-2-hydroxyethyl bacteriochlorophyllide A dehydrogenase